MFSFASLVYQDSVYFGGYPCKEWFDSLITHGTKIFVDTTSDEEKNTFNLYPYFNELIDTNILYFSYPIQDNNIPEDIPKFKQFIYQLCEKINSLKPGEKVYIHCKGGHGRSGMVTGGILCFLLNINPEKALAITTLAHSQRENLRAKWKNVRCPQTFRQRKFVIDVFRPIIITSALYEEKISEKWVDFLQESSIRPIKDKSNSKLLSEVLIHLRKILMKKSEDQNQVILCP
jgi:protein-tyrosine phosphatase